MGTKKDWSSVAKEVGRTAADCRDRYRNHLEHRDIRVSGEFYIFKFQK
jgi:Myb-like DNA-binding domain